MESNRFQLCLNACLEILVRLACEKKQIGFITLQKRLQKIVEFEVSHQFFELVLAKLNENSWRERKVLLTVLVKSKLGLPGMQFWAQAKTLGAITGVPSHEFEQRDTARYLSDAVFNAYRTFEGTQLTLGQ